MLDLPSSQSCCDISDAMKSVIPLTLLLLALVAVTPSAGQNPFASFFSGLLNLQRSSRTILASSASAVVTTSVSTASITVYSTITEQAVETLVETTTEVIFSPAVTPISFTEYFTLTETLVSHTASIQTSFSTVTDFYTEVQTELQRITLPVETTTTTEIVSI